ncbi:helix-turn-helix domain-containing protein [Saccharibacillus sp. O23]|uniref:helix-turn-helix domain-containing protein n=1 Tax=Saccharibacillus sp. O23 TaxID=2009338 RepID=UPI0015C65B4C|nr:helix-turn-helix domain-containing protein [Saccharibacillus sp. O23]
MTLLERSRAGDSQSLLHILELLEPDIEKLSRFMDMDRRDAAQALRTELIERVLKG